MAGIDEVARVAGVSTATVSRALSGRGVVSDATRAKVLTVAESLGYVVSASASSLASGRTRNIGVIVPNLDRWFFSTVLSGISRELMRSGYDTALYHLTEDPAARREVFQTFLRRRRVDGVIAVSIELHVEELDLLDELGIPIIAIGGPNDRFTTLSIDDEDIARKATQHLIDLGHREIAHIGASPDFDIDFHIPTRRRRGYETAMADAGIPPRADLYVPADFTVDGGFRAAGHLLDRSGDRLTAVFAASDEMAIGTILAARERGLRIPDDLSVIGVDGHPLGSFFRLTTVDQSPLGQGQRAAATILAELDDTGRVRHPSPAELPYALVRRESTGRPRR